MSPVQRRPDGTGGRALRVAYVIVGVGDAPAARRTTETARLTTWRFRITIVRPEQDRREPDPPGLRVVRIGAPGGSRMHRLATRAALPLVLARRRPDVVVVDGVDLAGGSFGRWARRHPTIAVARGVGSPGHAPGTAVPDPGSAAGTAAPDPGSAAGTAAPDPGSAAGTAVPDPGSAAGAAGPLPFREVIATSEATAAEIRERWPATPVTVLADGIADGAFATEARVRRHVVYIGPLDLARHRVDLLVEAWAAVAARSGEELLLVGDGPDEKALRNRTAELGLTERVRFAGRVAGTARYDILAGARVVLVPGPDITAVQTAAEALAVGSPVVAFDLPPLRDLVDASTGALVERGDTAAFAEAVLGLLASPARTATMGEAGKERVADRRWEVVADLEARIIERVAARSVGGQGPVAPPLTARPGPGGGEPTSTAPGR